MVAILVILATAVVFALNGFPLAPIGVWALIVGLAVWAVRFGPGSRAMARIKGVPWYRRW